MNRSEQSSKIVAKARRRRDKMRMKMCLGCKFNRYNFPDDLSAPMSTGIYTDFCWYMMTATRKRCLNKR